MIKPVKSTLIQELDKFLSADDYVVQTGWDPCHSTYLTDVMTCENIFDYILRTSAQA